MVGINVDFTFDFQGVENDINRQIDDVLQSVVKVDLPRILANAQANGFPVDTDMYSLLVTTKGKTRRRQLKTLNTRYLDIGKKGNPLEFRFVAEGQDYEEVIKAAYSALQAAIDRAPVGGPYSEPSKQGKEKYIDNITILVGDGDFTVTPIQSGALRNFPFEEGDRVYIAGLAPHSAIIEHGFFTRKYETRDLGGGILYYVKKVIAKQYKNVAIRFRYISFAGHKGRGTVPVIEIGILGSFATADTLPSQTSRRLNRMRGGR